MKAEAIDKALSVVRHFQRKPSKTLADGPAGRLAQFVTVLEPILAEERVTVLN